jgi:hypothetical protein
VFRKPCNATKKEEAFIRRPLLFRSADGKLLLVR